MATRKISKSAPTKKTSNIKIKAKTVDAPAPGMLAQFEESFNNYLKDIGSIYQNALKQYEDLINEYARKSDENMKGVNMDKEKVSTSLNDILKEAWRNSDANLKVAEAQIQSMKDLSEINSSESKEAEKLQAELLEKVLELNKKGIAKYREAFTRQKEDIKNKLRQVDENLDTESLYLLGYMQMATAYYGHITTIE